MSEVQQPKVFGPQSSKHWQNPPCYPKSMLSWLKKPERYFLLCPKAVKLSQYTKLEMTLIHLSFGIRPGIQQLIFHCGERYEKCAIFESHLSYPYTVVPMACRCFSGHLLSFTHIYISYMQTHVLPHTIRELTYSQLLTTTCVDRHKWQTAVFPIPSPRSHSSQMDTSTVFLPLFFPCAKLSNGSFLCNWITVTMYSHHTRQESSVN